jgi:hypothetical protein
MLFYKYQQHQCRSDGNLPEVQFLKKNNDPSQLINKLINYWHWVFFLLSEHLNKLYSTQNFQIPPFFLTISTGEA